MARAKQEFLANKFRDTLGTLEAVRNLQTQDAEFHDLLGLAWYETGDARKASDELQQAIKLEPRNSDWYFQLGLSTSNTIRQIWLKSFSSKAWHRCLIQPGYGSGLALVSISAMIHLTPNKVSKRL